MYCSFVKTISLAAVAAASLLVGAANAQTVCGKRTDIIRQLSRVTEPELETWFVETLQTDAHRKTREEAAENLAHFEGSANARHALEQAAENDKDRKVRSECRDALDKLLEDE